MNQVEVSMHFVTKTLLTVSFYPRNQPDPQAQAGFMSGEGQSYLLPISGLDQIVNIDKWSNTDVPGLWIYRSLTLGEDACLNLVFVGSFTITGFHSTFDH